MTNPLDYRALMERHDQMLNAARELRQTAQLAQVVEALWKGVYPDRPLPGGGGGTAGRPDQVDGGAGYTRGREFREKYGFDMDPASQLPQDRVPPVSPGLSGEDAASDWIAHDRMAERNWQAELDRKNHDAVFAVGEAHFDNDMAYQARQAASERASQPASQQAAHQQRNTRMGA